LLQYVFAEAKVLDLGCGNGRFARFIGSHGIEIRYTGIDGSSRLLADASNAIAEMGWSDTRLVHADLCEEQWWSQIEPRSHDFVAVIAVLQHIPSFTSRQKLMRVIARLIRPSGVVGLSNWQFLKAAHLEKKVLDWSEVSIDPEEVENGDYLLDWRSGGLAYRYCHVVTAAEVERLAGCAGLRVVESYESDGRRGDENLYSVLKCGDER
jgi:ubiquinone/menaquinone biosynthesis C-methylase UbiE